MQTKNEIFEILAKAITHRFDDRCVIDFENGDTMLVDFSDCGEPYETDCVCVWTLQRDIRNEAGEFNGIEELDYGSFVLYANVYDFVINTLAQHNGVIYVESF